MVLQDVGRRECSSILWSFARLGLDPDSLMPGTTHGLGQRFMADSHNATDQSYASLLLAYADLQLSPCKGQLLRWSVDPLSTLDMSGFSSQPLANIANSLTRLPQDQPSSQLLDRLYACVVRKLQAVHKQQQPKAQELAIL